MKEFRGDTVKKIGITTHYYKSINYGGNLQAYALCKYLNKNGYHAEQIQFVRNFTDLKAPSVQKKSVYAEIQEKQRQFSLACKRRRKSRIIKNDPETHNDILTQRRNAFGEEWHKRIPHSEIVYTKDTIQESLSEYDTFITGSDQVWNPKWYDPIYFLDFASGKRKLSYAASLAVESLDEIQKKVIKKSLEDYIAISVRESSAVELIGELTSLPVVHTVDPALLLEREEWDEICTPRIVEEDYMFCYFLGMNRKARKIATAFAKKRGLKIVMIPYAYGSVELDDIGFGDIWLRYVTPPMFLSLIKYADYVMTDSFHAVVFSHIYQRQYIAFNRSRRAEMRSRIDSFMELLGTQERFCCRPSIENLQYILSLSDIDYSISNQALEEQKLLSKKFLKDALDL